MSVAPRSSARALAAVLLAWMLGQGCVYYNGVYNAKAASHFGDVQLRADAEGEAGAQFQVAAAKAESVLLRHPSSKWRPRALYLAGRSQALSGQCDRAMPRLTEYLRLGGSTVDDRDRARVALGACELRSNRIPAARIRLDSLVDAHDAETARQARLWAARAALAAGDRDAVPRYLANAHSGSVQWELLSASVAAREFVRVESLLVERAGQADYRDDVARAVRELWSAGFFNAAEHVVDRYDASRVRDANRVALHYTIGDLYMRAGRDTLARRHLILARTLAGRDTAIEHEASARLSLLGLGRVATMRELDTLFARQDSVVRRAQYTRRVNEPLLLLRLLQQKPDTTGASLFLAAEVARDSLRAFAVARTMFLQVAREMPTSLLASRAWYAAALLWPDSAASWNVRVLTSYATTSVARWMRGEDPTLAPDFLSAAEVLRVTWTETVRRWTDSLRVLQTPPKPVAAPTRK